MNTKLKHAYAIITAVGMLFAITASSAFGAGGGSSAMTAGGGGAVAAKRQPISPASVFVLPSGKPCVSGHELTIQLRKLPHVRWIGATVKVNGKRVLTIKRSRIAAAVKLAGLPSGQFVLSITVKASTGRSVTATRTYQACVPGSKNGGLPVPPLPPVKPVPPVTPEEHVTPKEPSSPKQGHYTGTNPQNGNQIGFYVSPEGNLQDVSTPTDLACTPTRSTIVDHFEMGEVTVAANGSFSKAGEQEGVIEGEKAKFTYTLDGQLGEATATGTFREEVAYENGSKFSCSTNNQSWTASLDTHQSAASFPATEGHYAGTNPQNGNQIGVYVSPEGNLQDVSTPTDLACIPARSTIVDHFEMGEVAVAANGSFSKSTEQEGVIAGESAKFTYTFSGHVHGGAESGAVRIAGVLREDVVYENGSKFSCSTNNQSWTASLDTHQSAASFPATEGHYAGTNPQNGNQIGVYVSPEGNLQDVSTPTDLGCTPTRSTIVDHFEMGEVTVAANGSFTKTGEQEGVIEGEKAKFTYTFSGHVHGAGSSGAPRIAGVLREDIVYENGPKFSCSTNNQSWTLTHDEHQSPASFPATEGHYTGTNPQNGNQIGLYVSPEGNLQDVSTPTDLACTPTRSTIVDHFEMGEVAVAANGSFSKSTEQEGVIAGESAKFTYTFSGHVHGAAESGAVRIAGTFREDIVYENGSKFSCSTNNQSWTLTRDEHQSPASFPATEGHYTGTNPQNGNQIGFTVSSEGNLQNIATPTDLACTPTRSTIVDHFEMGEVTVASNGSFSKTTEQTGVIEGKSAKFTYTFSGHVHGAGSSGKPRIAGTFREDIAYENGSKFSCSTNNQSWTASLT